MNIFFTASIRGLEKFKIYYDEIFKYILNSNHKYLGNYPFKVTTRQVYSDNLNFNLELFNSMERFMNICDLMILEVSEHSVSMGYMIMKVLSLKKPVIALHLYKSKPAFLLGIEDDNFQLIEYEPKNLKKILNDSISFANNQGKSRFNLMLSPKLSSHIQEYSKKEGISKASFIRKLISQNMNKNNQKNLY